MFTGSGVALVTPFRDGEVDFEAFGRLIDWQIDNRTDALIACGTTGEPSTMTRAEKEAVIGFAVKRAACRVPVFAGTGGNDTREAIELSAAARALGADGLLMVTPYYNKTTQPGLIAHFTAVADAVDLPIILYNVPSRTGLNLLPATVTRLIEHPNIRGVKEASANIEQITELMRLCGDRVALYSGNDDHVVPLLALGGQGVISVTANVAPRMMHDMVAAWLAGDHASSLQLQFKLNPLTRQLFTEVNPIPVKAALCMMGMIGPEIRLPLVEL
ncbi:MAG: 4-hydroxy-tetrahydrodipicolinate synthase, partial [Clostridiales bacterium]|nr:4-hydroxy-tetrahydrodipicolinate synthase [Clostridiales bacterium]